MNFRAIFTIHRDRARPSTVCRCASSVSPYEGVLFACSVSYLDWRSYSAFWSLHNCKPNSCSASRDRGAI